MKLATHKSDKWRVASDSVRRRAADISRHASRVTRHASAFTLAEVLAAMLFLAIVIPAAVEALHVASLAGEVAARKGAAARIADRILNESIVTTNWNVRRAKRNGHGRRAGFPLDADQPELAADARRDAIADGGSEIFGAGPGLFGEVEHAGECAGARHDRFEPMKLNAIIESRESRSRPTAMREYLPRHSTLDTRQSATRSR